MPAEYIYAFHVCINVIHMNIQRLPGVINTIFIHPNAYYLNGLRQ